MIALYAVTVRGIRAIDSGTICIYLKVFILYQMKYYSDVFHNNMNIFIMQMCLGYEILLLT
jgi:hypothetical protein